MRTTRQKFNLILTLAVMLMTAQTAWAQGVNYLDASGTQQTCSTYTTMTSSTTSWSDGWYVVSNSTTINNRISVSGTVNLILCNNATLTASKGITIGSSATFNVYAQTEDEATMGALTATAEVNSNNSAIGGVYQTNFGTININGGKITATTNYNCGAPIGGAYGSNSGNITINGGIVSATAHDYTNCAGIGGGNNGYVSSIILNGGVITATGDTQYGGAGIGTGSYGGSGTMIITITSGVKRIVATKGYNSDCIGKGTNATTTVNVVFKHNNSEVTGDAKNAVFYDTGEGASSRTIRGNVTNHSITISNNILASVTANVAAAPEGETITLTVGTAVDESTLKVNDGNSDLTLTDIGNRQYTFVMPNADVTVTASVAATYSVTLPANMEIVSATNTADANGKYISGTTVTFKVSFPFTATSEVSDGTNTLTATDGIYSVTVGTADITITATTQRSATIDLSDAPSDFTAINNDVLTGSTSHTVTIANNVGITLSGATISGGIICNGTADITLVGTNSVTGMQYKAGVQIGGSGTTLTIKGAGSLTATGGRGGAGIGTGVVFANESNTSGNITIMGGSVTANGAEFDPNTHEGGDGIGKGYTYANATNTIGTVTITTGIDCVEASSISETVVYKHGETDVTANASGYFTINGSTILRNYTITYNLNDGTNATGNPATYNLKTETFTLENPSRDGYEFAGWFSDAEFNTPATTTITKGTTGDKTFWAKWTRPITSEGITISIPSQEWTGSEVTPVITVKDGETTLTLTTDYIITAPSGTIQNAGDYTYKITGAGIYTGETTATFTITPKAVTNANVTNTGTTPTITLTQDQNGTTATLDGASDGSVSITADVAVEKVILSREFGSGQKTAVCWPFAVSAEQTATLGKFYEFKGIDGDGKIEMQEVTTGLTENTPYIFEPSSDKTEIDFGAKTLKAGGPVSVSNGYTYKGIYSRVKWTTDTTDPLYNATLAGELGKAYGFALKDKTVGTTEYHKGQFVKLASGAHSRAFRAYLLYDGTWDGNQPTAAARRTTRGEGGLPDVIDIVWLAANSGTTGISSIGITHDGDAWYSLDGRKLNGKPTAKGLYIHNGRKEVVK